MGTYFIVQNRGYSNNSVSKANAKGAMKSKAVAPAVAQNIRHCLRLVEAQKSVNNPALSVQNKVYIIDPRIVDIKSGEDASTFNFFEKPLYEKENKGLCEVTFQNYMQKSIEERCLPNTVVSNATVQVIDLVLEVGRGDRPEGYTLEKWADKSIEWAEKQFGRENIFLAVLHNDETSPHLHILATPIVNGKFKGSSFHGNMETNRSTRESYLKAMDELGFQRALPPVKRKKARTTDEWRREMEGRTAPVREPLEGETPEEHYARIQAYCDSQSAKIQAQHDKSMNALDEKARELKAEEAKLNARCADFMLELEAIDDEKKKLEALQKSDPKALEAGRIICYATEHNLLSPQDTALLESLIEKANKAYKEDKTKDR